MAISYLVARSLCDAVAWDTALIRRALDGLTVPEIDERCKYLEINIAERPEALGLALCLCTAVSEHESTNIRVVASRPEFIARRDIWSIGQEWLELIRSAKRTVVMIAPSIDAAAVLNLQDALAAAYAENVCLTVLYGALGRVERIRSAISLIKASCPHSELLEWPADEGFLHAKAICVDKKIVYVGSANLTEFGWEKNVEFGLTLSGPMAVPLIEYCFGLVKIARASKKGHVPGKRLEMAQ